MSWFEPIDAYCERSGPEYWSEPVNAVTNGAFLLAAGLMAWRLRGGVGPPSPPPSPPPSRPLPLAWALVAVLAAIGIGSWLFHTHANRLSALLDVIPILIFILIYIFAATRDYLGARNRVAALAMAGFVPWTAALVPVFALIPGIGSSAGYAPVPLLILVYAAVLRRRAPETARGLAIGAGILILSLTFRSLDQPLCARIAVGTHFMWHILNALMLGWMIEVYRRHMTARPAG